MINFQEVEALINLQSSQETLLSLYIGVTSNDYNRHDCEIILKSLIKEKQKDLERLNKEERRSVENDFEKMQSFLKNEFDWRGKKGLAIFASAAANFWQIYALPQQVGNILILDRSAYLRPLLGLFDEYRRLGVVLIDKSKARIFEVFLGEIEEHAEVEGGVSRRVKVGGWKGVEESRIQRHQNEELHRHYKRVSDVLKESFDAHHCEELVVGGHQNEFSEFEQELHSSLKDKIIGHFESDLHVTPEDVLKTVLTLQQEKHSIKEDVLLNQLLEMTGQRMAVTGILGTLTAFRKGQIHSLVVGKEYSISGKKCSKCGYLDQKEKECPICQIPLNNIPDLIDDLIETTMDGGCKVEYILGNGRMHEWGGVGAFLRYKY